MKFGKRLQTLTTESPELDRILINYKQLKKQLKRVRSVDPKAGA